MVCIDRERRETCPPRLAEQVHRALDARLRKEGKSADTVSIVVADRSFESWLLADAHGLHQRRLLKKRPPFTCFEGRPGRGGKLGKAELRDLLGGSYSETLHGPELFRALDFQTARKHGPGLPGSKSLDKLLRELGA